MAGRRLGWALGLMIAWGPGCVLNNLRFDEDATEAGSSSLSASATSTSTSTSTSAADTSTAAGSDASGSASASASSTTTTTTTTTTGEATTTTGEPVTTTGESTSDAGTTAESDATTTGPACGDLPELCDGVDNNCNGLIDEWDAGLGECDASGSLCHLAAFGGRYYYACKGPLKPSQAHAKCQTFAVPDSGAQGFHVKIETPDENEFLVALVPLAGEISIGLVAQQNNGSQISHYTWIVDGAPLAGYGGTKGAPPWAAGEPNFSIPSEQWCAIRSDNFGWNNVVDKDLAYLCEAIPAG